MQKISNKWRLEYSMDRHGISLKTLYEKSGQNGPGLVIMKDNFENVFGFYTSHSLEVKKGFRGNGDWFDESYTTTNELHSLMIDNSFLWKIMGDNSIQVYHATGANDYLILCEPHCIALGGGYYFTSPYTI